MKKIGFVTPWYGENIPGGAEMALRGITGHLHQKGVEVEILTTCVKQFDSNWNVNFYHKGVEMMNGISVRRFPVRKRNTAAFDRINGKLLSGAAVTHEEEAIFLQEMINSPSLVRYMSKNKDTYSCYVFIPYMFGTTYYGIQAAPEKAVMIPCFHDEPYAYMQHFQSLFPTVRGMLFLSDPEEAFARKIYGLEQVKTLTAGLGVDSDWQGDEKRFRKKYRIGDPFILYAGRKDSGKNVHELIHYFAQYKKENSNDVKLVLIGGGETDIPAPVKTDVLDLGFVPIQDKYDAYTSSMLLCQPSKNESFSIVIMESWLGGRPVLVHEHCAVTKNFAIQSNGGLYYHTYHEFAHCVNYMLQHPDHASQIGKQGQQFVLSHFTWDKVMEQYISFFEGLAEE